MSPRIRRPRVLRTTKRDRLLLDVDPSVARKGRRASLRRSGTHGARRDRGRSVGDVVHGGRDRAEEGIALRRVQTANTARPPGVRAARTRGAPVRDRRRTSLRSGRSPRRTHPRTEAPRRPRSRPTPPRWGPRRRARHLVDEVAHHDPPSGADPPRDLPAGSPRPPATSSHRSPEPGRRHSPWRATPARSAHGRPPRIGASVVPPPASDSRISSAPPRRRT